MKTIVKNLFVFVVIMFCAATEVAAQNYTSTGDGNWNSPPRWNNTSGWGSNTPPTDGSHGSGTITMQHNMNINSNYTIGSSTLNIVSGKTLTVNGTMTLNGGSSVNVSGNLTITGDLVLNSVINILPGGVVSVNGNTYVNNSNNIIVGTNTAAPPYADLIIKGDLRQQSSGDVTVNRNGRVAIFGNVVGSSNGGTVLTLNQGAQMYVNGNVNYTGGGDQINNNNVVSPYGLYVNGTTTNSGGGSTTTTNRGSKTTMRNTNPAFYNWVASISGSPLPVTLIFFKVESVNENGIQLVWATASEEKFDHFEVETSTDGTVFTKLANVQGHGNSIVRNDYSHLVEKPVIGKSFYRLKSVDFDGYTEIFSVVSATCESKKSVSVFPNPVVDSKLNVNLNFQPGDVVLMTLTDMSGMQVARVQLNSIENQINLSVEPGTYILKVATVGFSEITRVVIR